jgi:hypothetical protein
MLKKFTFVITLVLATTVLPYSVAADGELVELCHHPPGNPEQHRMIVVDAAAVPAHLAHGDHLHDMCPEHEH